MNLRTAILLASAALPLTAQEPLYDESKVPDYVLPDPLISNDGAAIDVPAAWPARRAEILRAFEEHVYGRMPGRPEELRFEVVEEAPDALDGRATRRQIAILLGSEDATRRVDLLVYVPNERTAPAPAFLGLNFHGNHTVSPDPAIQLPRSWVPNDAAFGATDHRASETGRGARAHRWPVELVIEHGLAFATAYYGDLDPDFDDGFQNGLHPLLDEVERNDESWGAIGAWAFGLSRALDALGTVEGIDSGRVAVLGHSRLGKAALWAGACDERFALVVSNDSGCGGAALSRRGFGETIDAITRRFPHWFCARLRSYAGREDELPVDQHELIALIAPRPVYVASASDDRWADPRGEFLAVKGAEPVYALLGRVGIDTDAMPEPGAALAEGATGYHLRPGKHDLTTWDWERFLQFADRHLHAR